MIIQFSDYYRSKKGILFQLLIFRSQPGLSFRDVVLCPRENRCRLYYKEWFLYMVLMYDILITKKCFSFAVTINRKIFYHHIY